MNKTETKNIKDINNNELVIYENIDGTIRVEVEVYNENVWLTQGQIAELFNKNRTVITKHINKIIRERELEESVCAFFAHTAPDGKVYKTKYYNLDMIISVGYRVNSKRGIEFRRWASQVLKEYLIKGYSINQEKVIQDKLNHLKETVELLSTTLINQSLVNETGKELLSLISAYTKTWDMLIKYDEGYLEKPKHTHNVFDKVIDYNAALKAIKEFKGSLGAEAGNLFGIERNKGLDSILGNLEQTFGGEYLYTSLEERAAHLLYFIIKDHPFSDGNKRIGSFLFLLYLTKANISLKHINPEGMTALALLTAESDPTHKEMLIKLIMNLISN